MNRSFLLTGLLCVLGACHRTNAPDVSNVQVNLKIDRFDQFLFLKLDTSDATRAYTQLQASYPYFAPDFLTNILELPPPRPPFTDTVSRNTFAELKRFIHLTHDIYDSISPQFDEAANKSSLTQAFKYLKYYHPGYEPPRIVTYLGPFNAPGVALTNQAIAIGLQLYAGQNFSFYLNPEGIELYPRYISRRFEQPYIPVNVMTAVIQDLYPDKNTGRSLIEQMVEKGKQWYLLDRLLPETADSLKTGYTEQQLEWCGNNEGLVWDFLLQSNDLYSTEPSFIQTYIGEAPTTRDMPPASPGNIGQWIGWQIVQSYADKNPGVSADALMKMDAKKIFSASKYKPRYK